MHAFQKLRTFLATAWYVAQELWSIAARATDKDYRDWARQNFTAIMVVLLIIAGAAGGVVHTRFRQEDAARRANFALVDCGRYDQLNSVEQKHIDYLEEIYQYHEEVNLDGTLPGGMKFGPQLTINTSTCALSYGTVIPANTCRDFGQLTEAQQIGITDLVLFWQWRPGTSATRSDDEAVINPVTCKWGWGDDMPPDGIAVYQGYHGPADDSNCRLDSDQQAHCTNFPGVHINLRSAGVFPPSSGVGLSPRF